MIKQTAPELYEVRGLLLQTNFSESPDHSELILVPSKLPPIDLS
jgi:hypothetical protein